MKKTIKLNGNTFTTAGDFIETLFSPINGKTAAGFYAKKKNGILFHKPDGSPWFFLVANKHGERFFVSCGTANNRLFYMNALCSSDEKQLGIEGMKYSEEIALAERIWEEFEPSQAIALS